MESCAAAKRGDDLRNLRPAVIEYVHQKERDPEHMEALELLKKDPKVGRGYDNTSLAKYLCPSGDASCFRSDPKR